MRCGSYAPRAPLARGGKSAASGLFPPLRRGDTGGCFECLCVVPGSASTRLKTALATMPSPHAPRRRDQRVQVVRRPFPAAYCLTPTAELAKSERGPSSTSGPILSVCHQTGRSLRKNQFVCPRSPPLDRRPFSRGRRRSTASGSRPACRKHISRNSCSLVGLSDFPELAGHPWMVPFCKLAVDSVAEEGIVYTCLRSLSTRNDLGVVVTTGTRGGEAGIRGGDGRYPS